MLAIFVILLFIVLTILLIFVISILYSAKYDFDFVQDENGNWTITPVFHPCGEPIDEDFIKEWHRKKKLYEAQYKNSFI